jgi:signal transduction histidine kinase
VDQDGQLLPGTPKLPLNDRTVAAAINEALAGRQPEPAALLLPWEKQPMVLAEPAMVDGEVRGAVVTVSPTEIMRGQVLMWWTVVFFSGLVVLGAAILLALPVVEWILRPIRQLDDATGRVATAVAGGSAFAPVGGDTGPPELRKLARSFDDMAGRVGEVVAAQRAFVADASHQLRNPLTALHIRLSSLDGMVDEAASEDYQAAVSETQRLHGVLEALLALARTEAASTAPVSTDATEAVRERVEAWRAVASARDIELSLDEPEGLTVFAVPRAVDGILDALLDNALKFTAEAPGAHEPLVEVTARQDGRMVVIAVRDHGPGLTEAELSRATDRFWRSPSQQNVSGSGLGLAIVRRIAERSHGGIRLDLPDGGGLRVSVELPCG